MRVSHRRLINVGHASAGSSNAMGCVQFAIIANGTVAGAPMTVENDSAWERMTFEIGARSRPAI